MGNTKHQSRFKESGILKMKLKPDQSLPVKPLARKKKPKNAKVQFETVIEKVKCGKCCYDCNYWAKAYRDISCTKKKTLREVLRKVCKKFKISLKDYSSPWTIICSTCSIRRR